MSQAPWYKRFAGDFVSDPYVQAMTAEQYGWYSAMLDLAWLHTPRGFLPNDKQLLSKMVGRCDELHFATHAQIVLDRFQTTEDGKYIFHPKMMEQVDHIAQVSEKRSDAGKKGAQKRHVITTKTAQQKPQQAPSKPQAIAQQLPIDSDSDSESELKPSGSGEPDPRRGPTKDYFIETHARANEMRVSLVEWDGREGKALNLWLAKHKMATQEEINRCIDNFYLSDRQVQQRIAKTIPNLMDYYAGEVNQFGTPRWKDKDFVQRVRVAREARVGVH